MEKNLWHSMPIPKIFSVLHTSENGLTTQEAEKRLKKFGDNSLPEAKKLTLFILLVNQLKSPLVYILIGAAIISILLQDFVDAAIIMVAVLVNTILGLYQENKANKSIAYLRKLIDLKSKVLRNDRIIEISSKKIVPGDIIHLEAGDKIPADARLILADHLSVVEASLTGESVPSEKFSKIIAKGEPLAERENMVYSGTVIASGRGVAVACETGIVTEIGQITKLIKETKEEQTPLQNQISALSRTLTYTVIFLCAIIIIIGKLQGRKIFGFGEEAREGLLNIAAAIAVAAIPEGLLLAITAVLAVGMQAILKKKALVRKLIAAETLGGVSVICTDKTGTLTEGKMRVSKIITADEELLLKSTTKYQNTQKLKDRDLLVKISLLCNNSSIENPDEELENYKIIGNPTEAALLLGALQSNIPYEEIKSQQPRLSEIPFDSEWKYMATLNKLDQNKNVIYVKGAPEKIFGMSSQIRVKGKSATLTKNKIEEIEKKYEKLTNQGLRVLAFAYKKVSAKKTIDLENELSDMIFAGFIALKDPLRNEAKNTFALTKKAGIKPIIITGDHKLTAKAIVSELGIKVTEKNIIEGGDLDKMDDNEFNKIFKQIIVYARVEPKHKLRIITAWKNAGEIVAMTGDGVNDAPALKAADVGIALGSGSDVAKETSDMILLDNNFKTIVDAIERGRIMYDNIKKIILYVLADSFSEIILIGGALLMALPLPVLPAQIIWINLVTDGLPSFALTFEPGEKEVMRDKPRKKGEKILGKDMKKLIFIISIVTNFLLLGLFYFLLSSNRYELDHIRTLIFATLSLDSLFYVFSCRSLRHTILSKNLLSNKFLIIGVLVGFILQLAAIYQPHLQKIFDTVPLGMADWVLILSLGIIEIIVIEIAKYYLIIRKNNLIK